MSIRGMARKTCWMANRPVLRKRDLFRGKKSCLVKTYWIGKRPVLRKKTCLEGESQIWWQEYLLQGNEAAAHCMVLTSHGLWHIVRVTNCDILMSHTLSISCESRNMTSSALHGTNESRTVAYYMSHELRHPNEAHTMDIIWVTNDDLQTSHELFQGYVPALTHTVSLSWWWFVHIEMTLFSSWNL